MRVPGFWSFAARSFSLQFPAAGTLCCRLLGPSQATRNMSSKRKMDHLERTAGNNRQNALYPAEVRGIINESETVKRLRIAVPPDFSFKAGQWVDLFIPGVEKVGGFSMCSGPGLLQREGIVELAVKYAKHPPAHWIHTMCTVGSQVAMRVGGDFFFDPRPLTPLLICCWWREVWGSTPCTPSCYTSDLLHRNQASGGRDLNIGSAHLCYSAKNPRSCSSSSIIVRVWSSPTSSPVTSTSRSRSQMLTHTSSLYQPWENHRGGAAFSRGPAEDFVLPVWTPAHDRNIPKPS
ncbi:hypothetical protein KUCAC02_011806 [Chaenocephalus aceratus]|uniref:Uncharacterized protein n=1 Tax=Chaenocephalus aceratus TaxID=36190 RepID=A0ACB9WYF2_CHAAC|nr:hypothetical protein KUCAC02_011806 [Chaenocephalus aceratus]